MANKRKRRLQRQRAAAKADTPVVTHKQIWKTYTVAWRVESRGGPVNVIAIKEYDEDELIGFIMRIADVKTIDEFQVLDVHHTRDDGAVEVLWELADWPIGVGTSRSKGEFMRGVNDSPLFLKSNTPAGTKPLESKASIIMPDEKAKSTAKVTPALFLKKLPLRWYTLGKVITS